MTRFYCLWQKSGVLISVERKKSKTSTVLNGGFLCEKLKSICPPGSPVFKEGKHRFEPMKKHYFPDDVVLLWKYLDRLMIRLLFVILRSTFKHIIPKSCVSTGGPNAIKPLTQQLKRVLKKGKYQYFIRFDIKGYYANIDRAILFEQLKAHYDDPLTLDYLKAIVFNAVDDNGIITVPEKGIPTRSSLSPFFGALYLSPLDLAFGSMRVFYRCFVADGIILLKNKHQYTKAKRRLFSVLRSLKLEVSPQKTKMGKLSSLHLLGVDFEVSQTLQGKIQVTVETYPPAGRLWFENAPDWRLVWTF
jgi:hypothetical protein